MLTLLPNIRNIIGRLFFVAIIFFFGFLFFKFELKESNNEHVVFKIPAIHFEFKAIYVLFFLIATIGFLALTIIASLLSINKVVVDTTLDSITFFKLLGKQTISTASINEYFETTHTNAFKSWTGLIIKMNDNRIIQVAGQNIKSISELRNYLNERNISCAGQKRMKLPFN